PAPLPPLVAPVRGGSPLVLGMPLAAALFELARAPMLRRWRPLFPPESAGIIVLLVGITSGAIGVRMIAGAPPHSGPGAALSPIAVASFALVVMTALNVWTTGVWRIACVLAGTLAGILVSAHIGGDGGPSWP